VNEDVDRKTLLLSQEVKRNVSPQRRFQPDPNESVQHPFQQRLTFGSSQQSQLRQSPGHPNELLPNE